MTITKDDLVELLEKNPTYQKALGKVSEDQQEKIRTMMEGYMENATRALLPFIERLESNPELAEIVRRRLKGEEDPDGEVVIDDGPDDTGPGTD